MGISKNFYYENDILKGVHRNYHTEGKSIGQTIYDTFTKYPDHIGHIEAETGKKFTFSDMNKRSIRLAVWLREQGVGINDIVAICTPNHIDVISIVCATIYIGAIYNPWDHELDVERARKYMKIIQPKVMFSCDETLDILQEAAKLEHQNPIIIGMDKTANFLAVDDIINYQSEEKIKNFKLTNMANSDVTCLIAFTSGTIGTPKAVEHSYEASLINALATCDNFIIDEKLTITLTYFFPSWNIHLWFLLAAIIEKCTTIVHREFEAAATCQIIETYKVNILNLHSYQLMHVCNENTDRKYNLDSIKIAVPAGTKLRKRVLDLTKIVLPNAFIRRRMGMTETSEVTRFTPACLNWSSAGQIRPSVQIKIINVETGKSLGRYQEGELLVKTPGMMKGYYNNPEATQECFDKEGWYHTGDRGYVDDNGELIMIGRLIECIKYRYYDIYPSYLEGVIGSHPAILDVAVVAVPHPLDVERPLAFVRFAPGAEVSEDELIKLTENHDYNRLFKGEIKVVDKMPMSTNGKIQKRVLKELALKMIGEAENGSSTIMDTKEPKLDVKQNIGEVIYNTLNNNKDHIAQIDGKTGKRLTFGDINERNVRLSIWLRRQGINSGDMIALCSYNQSSVCTVIMSIFYIGGIYNPWDHELDLVKARKYMKLMKPKVMFSCEEKIEMLEKAAELEKKNVKFIVLGNHQRFDSFENIIQTINSDEIEGFKVIHEKNPSDIGTIVFSSGTVGDPKAIAHNYERVLENVVASGLVEDVEARGDIILDYVYPSWVIHTWFLLDSIIRKDTEIIHHPFDVDETCGLIEKHKVTVVYLHSYLLMHICNTDNHLKYNLESVKILIPVGTKLSLKLLDKCSKIFPNAFVSRGMGMTETGEISRFTEECKNLLSEGIPRPHVQIKIIDKTGRTLGPNETGELCVKTPSMMAGYYIDGKTVRLESEFDDEGWFHTGDRAHLDENNEIIMMGRVQEVVKYRYYDIFPSYIEDLLKAHPGVEDAAIVPVPHEFDVERPMAFIQRTLGSKVTKEELADLTNEHGYHKIHANEVSFLDKMPRNSNGKINKRQLKETAKTIVGCSST